MTSRDDRIHQAQQSITLHVTQNLSTTQGYGVASFNAWESAHVLGAVAMTDYIAGTRTWEQSLTQVFSAVMANLGHGNM
jgi:predicted transcriptional regulator